MTGRELDWLKGNINTDFANFAARHIELDSIGKPSRNNEITIVLLEDFVFLVNTYDLAQPEFNPLTAEEMDDILCLAENLLKTNYGIRFNE